MDWPGSSSDLAGGYSHSYIQLVHWLTWLASLSMWSFILTKARLILTWLWQCHTPRYRRNRNACTCVPRDMYKNVYIALFIKIKNCKQPKYLSIVEWIHKLQCIYMMDIYITRQMKELQLYTGEI